MVSAAFQKWKDCCCGEKLEIDEFLQMLLD